MIILVKVKICNFIFNDDGLTEFGLKTVGHTSIVGAEDDLVVAFEGQRQFLVDFGNFGSFVKWGG